MDRYLFLPIPYRNRNIAINDELMIDYEKGNIYIHTQKDNIQFGYDRVKKITNDSIVDLLGNVELGQVTLNTIAGILSKINKWRDTVNTIDSGTIVNTVPDIYDKLLGISKDDDLGYIMRGLVKSKEGYQLSDNNFTDEMFNIINNSSFFSNKYNHPYKKQCAFFSMVKSVNGRTGDIIITASELNIDGIHPKANNYVHPIEKMCTLPIVTSVNDKTGNVMLNKSDLGLSNIENYAPATKEDAIKGNSNVYLTSNLIDVIFDQYIFDYMLSCKVGFDGSIIGVLLQDFDAEKLGSAPTIIKGKTRIKVDNNLFECYIKNIGEIYALDVTDSFKKYYQNNNSLSIKYNITGVFSSMFIPTGNSKVDSLLIENNGDYKLFTQISNKITHIASNVSFASIHNENILYITRDEEVYIKKYDNVDIKDKGNRLKIGKCIKAIGNSFINAFLLVNGEVFTTNKIFRNVKDIAINDHGLFLLSNSGSVYSHNDRITTFIKTKIGDTKVISIDARGNYLLVLNTNNIPIVIEIKEGDYQ